jgi:hypothetical protein
VRRPPVFFGVRCELVNGTVPSALIFPEEHKLGLCDIDDRLSQVLGVGMQYADTVTGPTKVSYTSERQPLA